MHRESSQEIEYLKGFAILAVLVIHGFGIYSAYDIINGVFYCKLWIDQYSRFGIPLLFFVSGFLLHLRYPAGHIFDLKSYYIQRFISVVPSYVVFTVVYWIYFEIYNFNAHGDPFDLDLPRLVRHLVFSDASSHFWFFAMLFQLYLVYPLILRIYHRFSRNNCLWLFLMLAFLVQVLDCIFDTRSVLTKQVLDGIFPGKLEGLKGHFIHYPVFLSRVFYFVLGMFVHQHYSHIKETLKKANLPALLALILVMTTMKTNVDFNSFLNEGFFAKSFINFYGLVNIIINILNFIVLLKISLGLKFDHMITRFLGAMGANSIGIYLVHMLFVSGLILWSQVIKLNPNQWFYYPILFIGTTAMSFWVVEKLSRLRYGQYFIGAYK